MILVNLDGGIGHMFESNRMHKFMLTAACLLTLLVVVELFGCSTYTDADKAKNTEVCLDTSDLIATEALFEIEGDYITGPVAVPKAYVRIKKGEDLAAIVEKHKLNLTITEFCDMNITLLIEQYRGHCNLRPGTRFCTKYGDPYEVDPVTGMLRGCSKLRPGWEIEAPCASFPEGTKADTTEADWTPCEIAELYQ